MNKLATEITKKRTEKGYTQNLLANKAGMSAAQLSNIEQGKNKPTTITLYKIALALDCDFEELLKISKEE